MRTAEPTMDLDRRFEVLTKAAFVLLVRHVFKLDILLEGFFCLFVMPGTLQSLPEVPGRSHGPCPDCRDLGIWGDICLLTHPLGPATGRGTLLLFDWNVPEYLCVFVITLLSLGKTRGSGKPGDSPGSPALSGGSGNATGSLTVPATAPHLASVTGALPCWALPYSLNSRERFPHSPEHQEGEAHKQ